MSLGPAAELASILYGVATGLTFCTAFAARFVFSQHPFYDAVVENIGSVLTNGPSACCPIHNPLFAASNTAACWNSANCPAVFQSRSHVSGNKQDLLHETLDVPHDGQVCRGADHSIINSCVSTEGHQDVSHLVDLGTARSVSRNQATPAVQTCTNLANSSYAHP